MILFIYGSQGAAIEVYDMVLRNDYFGHQYNKIYFVDDFVDEEDYYGTKRIHYESCKQWSDGEEAEFAVAVGEPSVRRILYERVKDNGYKLAILIDRTAIVSDSAQVGEGSIINAYAIVSAEATIKENCFIMFQSIIGHHADVGRDCVICPKATIGGYSHVGRESFLGLGSSLMQHVDIGCECIVGLGAKVFRTLGDGETVIGNPARVTRGKENHKVFS